LPVFERPDPRERRRREVGEQIASGSLGVSVAALESIDTRSDRKREKTSKKTNAKASRKEPERIEDAPPRPLPPLSDDERKLVEAIGPEPMPIDLAIRASGLSASRVVGLIASLELKRVLRRLEGACVERLR